MQQSYVERNTTGLGGFINNVPLSSHPWPHPKKPKTNKQTTQTNRKKTTQQTKKTPKPQEKNTTKTKSKKERQTKALKGPQSCAVQLLSIPFNQLSLRHTTVDPRQVKEF